MKHTTPPDRDTTGRTRHSGQLFERELVSFHADRVQ